MRDTIAEKILLFDPETEHTAIRNRSIARKKKQERKAGP